MTDAPAFRGGRNIAIKTPAHDFERLIGFYQDTLGLEVVQTGEALVAFRFGDITLWVDRVATLSQAEIWLELNTDDTAGAARHFTAQRVARCDDIERLPAGLDGFWIAAPGNIVHLVCKPGA